MKSPFIFLAALTWSVITTILFCLPGSAFPQENWFSLVWFDKWIHVILFVVMVLLWCAAIRPVSGNEKGSFIQIAFYFLLYGVAIEIVQKYFIPNRSFDVGDMIADAIGCAIGLVVSMRVYIKK